MVNLMAFYGMLECNVSEQGNQRTYEVRDHKKLMPRVNERATEFLKQTCQLWSLQSSSKIDLKLLLTKNGFLMTEDIKRTFLIPIITTLSTIK
jgi:hypothetical protein